MPDPITEGKVESEEDEKVGQARALPMLSYSTIFRSLSKIHQQAYTHTCRHVHTQGEGEGEKERGGREGEREKTSRSQCPSGLACVEALAR